MDIKIRCMIDLFEMYEELSGSVNTQQGGHVRPYRNFLQWANAISLGLFEEKFAAWSKSQKVVDDLARPFLRSANVVVTRSNSNYGVVAFPGDYAHFSSARHYRAAGSDETLAIADLETFDECGKKVDIDKERPSYINEETWHAMKSQEKVAERKATIAEVEVSGLKETTIDLISNDRWGAVMEHRFMRPKLADPKMTQYDAGFKVAPAGVTMIVMDYLRMPLPATFVYTVAPGDVLTGRGEYVIYDKTKSQQLEWSSLIRNEFLVRLEKKYGKYIREGFIWQTSESDRKQTT